MKAGEVIIKFDDAAIVELRRAEQAVKKLAATSPRRSLVRAFRAGMALQRAIDNLRVKQGVR